MSTNSRFRSEQVRKKVLIYILAIALPIFFFSLYFIQETAGKELRKLSAEKAARLKMKIVSRIEHYLEDAAGFTREAAYMVRLYPEEYRMLLPFLKKNVRENPRVYGSALALEPAYFGGGEFCTYFFDGNGSLQRKTLLPPAYDYLSKAWYRQVRITHQARWSRPYFDKGGGEIFMSTYSYPLLDREDRFFGVVTADIAIDVLSRQIQAMTFSPEGFVWVLDRNGTMLSRPDAAGVAGKKISDLLRITSDSSGLEKTIRSLLRHETLRDDVRFDGKAYLLYGFHLPRSDLWVAIFLDRDLLYAPLHTLERKLILLGAGGLFLIFLMIFGILKEFRGEVAAQTKIQSELDLATGIQQSFLPRHRRCYRRAYRIESCIRPAREVGGDLYGYIERENSVILYVGDVSGKGVPAALFMMATQILIENALEREEDPAAVVTAVNRKLFEISRSGMFVTLLVIRWDFRERTLRYCNAGHPSFLVKTERLWTALPTFQVPLNTFETTVYRNDTLQMDVPFGLLCFSDGVEEAMNAEGELFGMQRVAETLAGNFTLIQLRRALQAFVGETPPHDDVTIISLRTRNFSG